MRKQGSQFEGRGRQGKRAWFILLCDLVIAKLPAGASPYGEVKLFCVIIITLSNSGVNRPAPRENVKISCSRDLPQEQQGVHLKKRK